MQKVMHMLMMGIFEFENGLKPGICALVCLLYCVHHLLSNQYFMSSLDTM